MEEDIQLSSLDSASVPPASTTTTTTTTAATTATAAKAATRVTLPFTAIPVFPSIVSSLKTTPSYYRPANQQLLPLPASNLPVLVLHPGSCQLRLGRSTDAVPRHFPHCLARRINKKISSSVISTTNDCLENYILDHSSAPHNEIDEDLKKRIRLKKLRIVPNSTQQCISFNESVDPVKILDHNDPYKIDWTRLDKDCFVGQEALRLPTTSPAGKDYTYKLFHPILHGLLNTRDYTSIRAVMADLAIIWIRAIESELGILARDFPMHNVILVIPHSPLRLQVDEMVRLLLAELRFNSIILHQESVMATFGAGISSACVVDIGGQVSSVSCVEDGLCFGSSRFNLKYGGDDITRLFTSLLKTKEFPYTECDITKNYYDWILMNELKERTITLNEMELTINVGDFYVRVPNMQTRHYKFKIYDDAFKAPMALFTPSVFNFQFKLRHLYEKNTFLELQCANMNPDGVSAAGDLYSVSTSTVEASANNYLVADGGGGGSNLQVSSSLPSGEMDSPLTGLTSTGNNQQLQQQPFVATNSAANVVGGTAASDAVDEDGTAPMAVDDHEMKTSSVADGESNSNNPTATTTSAEVIAVDQPSSSTTTTTTTSSTTTTHPSGMPLQQHLQKQQHDRLFLPQSPLLPRIIDPIDQVSIPLDIAIARSIARYASTLAQTGLRDRDIDDRVRRICSSVLLIGGGSMIPSLTHYLQERLSFLMNLANASDFGLFKTTHHEDRPVGVGVIQSPREMDSRVLVWKGASILSKLDVSGDMWVSRAEYEIFGLDRIISRSGFLWE